ncbi:MAG TPA: ATP-binding protein [Candidatus Sulfotelmatobacter sp.]|nr:ATP-binding protein [Candidatus Sulfotelmatobacter sp.]
MKPFPIVAVRSFIEATRDTGYKSTGSAIAELVDNALEASAKHVNVTIEHAKEGATNTSIIRVTDDGAGMTPAVLRLALQFGGTTRFGSRVATGRYGMGLPNGGLSQARRLEVFTWTDSSRVWSSYLDVDEIATNSMRAVPKPRITQISIRPRTRSGTIVVLSKCDRLDCDDTQTLELKFLAEFGRIFRQAIHDGRLIKVNGTKVRPFDPLFLAPAGSLSGAKLYGPPLEYKLRVPAFVKARVSVSVVSVRFSELPVQKWHHFSNEKKNDLGIAKNAGVSIVRAGREIDYGWYFMGTKRKENYDDWWRCEVAFTPELDELFGVTHSKQKINPTRLVSSILTPEIERIARELNSRVRSKFTTIKGEGMRSHTLKRLQARDHLLEPPRSLRGSSTLSDKQPGLKLLRKRNDGVHGLRFAVTHNPEQHNLFFSAQLRDGLLSLNINECHPFYSSAYRQLASEGNAGGRQDGLQYVLLLLVSCARAECLVNGPRAREIMRRFRQIWSDAVAAFLS